MRDDFYDDQSNIDSTNGGYDYYDEAQPPRSKGKKILIILGIFIAVVIGLAAMTNPSKSEAKDEVKTLIADKLREKATEEAKDEENNGMVRFISGVASFFAPKIVDNFLQIDVNNYVIFSTFDVMLTMGEEEPLLKGFILFDQVIVYETSDKLKNIN